MEHRRELDDGESAALAHRLRGANTSAFIAGQLSGNTFTMGGAVYADPLTDDPDLDKVYVVYSDLAEPDSGGDGDLDVFLLRSLDGGATWSCPIRVNNDDVETPYILSDQYYPAICVDDAGRAHVVWYDTRNDPQSPGSHVTIDLFYARVDGQTGVPCDQVVFENWNANQDAIDTAWLIHDGPFKLGDYIAIAPIPNGAIAVYMGTNHPRIGHDGPSTKADETIYSKRITWP